MFRVAASTVARRAASRSVSRGLPAISARVECFHGTSNVHAAAAKKDDKEEDAAPPAAWWQDPMYGVPLGIAFAVPAINYEWYLVNEETQLAACFIAFSLVVYKQFGGVIKEALEEDGKRTLAEHNEAEDVIITMLEEKIADVKLQENIVQDAEDIKALKIETYAKLNDIGKVKPLYDFKAQVERVLHMVEAEEANMQERAKHALMEEATEAVSAEFLTSKALKKASLELAVAQLKGSGAGAADPVKDAYLKFFADKKQAAAKMDEKAELAASREAMLSKINATAKNEGFFFEFDPATGKPKLVV